MWRILAALMLASVGHADHVVMIDESSYIAGIFANEDRGDPRIIPLTVDDARALHPLLTPDGCPRYRWDGERAVLDLSSPCISAADAARKQERVDATNHEMARLVEVMLVRLLAKGVVTKSDFPAKVWTVINARRAIRGEEPIQ